MSFRSRRQVAAQLLAQLYRVCKLKVFNHENINSKLWFFHIAHILASATDGPIYQNKKVIVIKGEDKGKVKVLPRVYNFKGLSLETLKIASDRCGLKHISDEDFIAIINKVEDWHSKGHQRPSVKTISKSLQINAEERELCHAWNLPAIDETKPERIARRKRNKLEQKATKRRNSGAKPHSESLAQTKPWEAEGISRATYFRRQKQSHETKNSLAINKIYRSENNQSHKDEIDRLHALLDPSKEDIWGMPFDVVCYYKEKIRQLEWDRDITPSNAYFKEFQRVEVW